MVHVDAEVAAETGGVSIPIRLLVDSGAVYSVLPYDAWRSLGLQPSRTMDFVLADGTVVSRDVSHAMFTYQGIRAPSPVVLGGPRDEALLGAVTLESMGLVLNPFERTLRPMKMRLASAAPVATC